MGKIIAVTGGTGFVGRAIVRTLLDRGMSVRMLVRPGSKAKLPSGGANGATATSVMGDVCDSAKLEQLVDGVHACIHLVGIIREDRSSRPAQTFQRMHVQATRTVVGACETKGVKRYLHMSALGASATSRAEYARTKLEGEQIVQRSELDWTIFRPSMIHGPEGEFVKQAAAWATGLHQPFIFMPYFRKVREDTRVPLGPAYESDPLIAPIAVEDVASAFAGAIDNEQAIGEIYNLVGAETLSWPAMLRFIRDHVPSANHRIPAYGVPGDVAARIAQVASGVGVGGLLPYDQGQAWMGSEDSTATLDKAKAHLGFEPKAFRQAFKAYAGQLNSMH